MTGILRSDDEAECGMRDDQEQLIRRASQAVRAKDRVKNRVPSAPSHRLRLARELVASRFVNSNL